MTDFVKPYVTGDASFIREPRMTGDVSFIREPSMYVHTAVCKIATYWQHGERRYTFYKGQADQLSYKQGNHYPVVMVG